MESIFGIVLLATLIEGLVTYLFGKTDEGYTRPWLAYVSLALGVTVSIAYQVDIPAMVGLVSPIPYVGYVVSGLVLGRGSNYLNDILRMIK
jgi:hypothetical protein